jgi:hypothetical protein
LILLLLCIRNIKMTFNDLKKRISSSRSQQQTQFLVSYGINPFGSGILRNIND